MAGYSFGLSFMTIDLQATDRSFTQMTARERVGWSLKTFPDQIILSTSFGAQAAVMLHLTTSLKPDIPVVFVDTGYLFPETYRFAERLQERLELNLRIYLPKRSAAHQEAVHGKRWEKGEETLRAYNLENKVEPMNRAIEEAGARAWLSGLRRSQASSRSNRTFIERQNKVYKIYPILDWSDRDVYLYLREHELPYHPLWDLGYVSIGDWHSTATLREGMTAEETRFGGKKRECGLHELSGNQDFQI